MKDSVREYFILLREKKKHAQRLFALLLCLSILVSSNTSWQLHLIGIGYTGDEPETVYYCDMTEHKHDAKCEDEDTPSCGKAEGAMFRHEHTWKCVDKTKLECDIEEHTHTGETGTCYADGKALICAVDHHNENCYELVDGYICYDPASTHVHTKACEDYNTLYSCGKTEHTHTDENGDCYETKKVEICTSTEEGHTHTEQCYKEERVLKCQLEEHKHDDSCTTRIAFLACEQHEHTDACKGKIKNLVCTDPEHEHDAEECFQQVRVLSCEKEEHTHGVECYQIVCGVEEGTLEEHEHEPDCYICHITEHTHGLACLSDPEADTESKKDYTESVPHVSQMGQYWYENILMVAESQLGYKESEKNYIVDENVAVPIKKGYTRYGQWYTDMLNDASPEGAVPVDYRYADWQTLFAYFVYYNAGFNNNPVQSNGEAVSFNRAFGIPFKLDAEEWAGSLNEAFEYAVQAEYEPMPGSLIFLDKNGDDTISVGIVKDTSFDEENGYNLQYVDVYEGDYLKNGTPCVTVNRYTLLTPPAESEAQTDSTAPMNAMAANDLSGVAYTKALDQRAANDSTSGDGTDGGMSTSGGLTSDRDWDTSRLNSQIVGFGYSKQLYNQASGKNTPSSIALDSKTFLFDEQAGALIKKLEENTDGYVICQDTYALTGEQNTAATLKQKNIQDSDFGTKIDDYTWIFEKISNQKYKIKNKSTGEYLQVTGSNGNYTLTTTTDINQAAVFEALENSGNKSEIRFRYESWNGSSWCLGRSNSGFFEINTYGYGSNTFLKLKSVVTYNPITTTVTPSSTVINLYDYRVKKTNVDTMDGWNINAWKEDYSDQNTDVINNGINKNHNFKFSGYSKHNNNRYVINDFTGFLEDNNKGYPLQGIVQNELVDGYPKLDNLDGSGTEPLKYLFDEEDITVDGLLVKKTFTDVGGLLQLDPQGYYYYTSSDVYNYNANGKIESKLYDGNYAVYNSDSRTFTVYDNWALYHNNASGKGRGSPTLEGQFFPFDPLDERKNQDKDFNVQQKGEPFYINHYFGLELISRFTQRYDGHTDSTQSQNMTFEFSGDDDIWVFIDDVLVADLGGIHIKLDFKIDFSTGKVTYGREEEKDGERTHIQLTSYETTIRDMFKKADVNNVNSEAVKKLIQDAKANGDNESWKGNTFANNTTHTLKLFYLERGGDASNLYLRSNLSEIPRTGMTKVDQYNNTVAGATFAFYPAEYREEKSAYYYYKVDRYGEHVYLCAVSDEISSSYDESTHRITITTSNGQSYSVDALYWDVTDANGELTFVDSTGVTLTLKEIKDLLGETFVMREVRPPDGYRTVSAYTLVKINDCYMQVLNPYVSGVWTNPNILITANNKLYVTNARKNSGTDPYYYQNVAEKILNDPNTPSGSMTKKSSEPYYEISYHTITNTGYDDKGLLFGVVLQKNNHEKISKDNFTNGDPCWSNVDTWDAVYGSNRTGYTTVTNDDSNETNIEAVLTAAREQLKLNSGADANLTFPFFKLSSSGTMTVTVDELPGDPDKYFTALLNSDGDTTESEYYLAFYWTSADSLDNANKDNTVRVRSHDREFAETVYKGFDIAWGASIEVPNVLNNLYFTKVDEAGNPMDHAQFAIYRIETDSNGGYSYKAVNNNYYYLRVNENGVQQARASGSGDNWQYTYEILYSPTNGDAHGKNLTGNAGRIVIKDSQGKEVTYIEPVQAAETHSAVENDSIDPQPMDQKGTYVEGTGHFEKLLNGKYIVREIKAPDGYKINKEEIKVIVNETGVYANAGTADDNIAVGHSPGNLVTTMNNLADPDVDDTLTYIDFFIKRGQTYGNISFELPSTAAWYIVMQDKDKDFPGHGSLDPSMDLTKSIQSSDYTQAMINYMVYDAEHSEFDYRPETAADNIGTTGQDPRDHSLTATSPNKFQEGQGTNRLYTDVGWSTFEIYQDNSTLLDNIVKATGKNYNKLGSRPIRALYTGGTFIEVTDERDTPPEIDLKVQKVGTGGGQSTNIPLEGAQFRLYQYVKDTATQRLVKKYYQVTESQTTPVQRTVDWVLEKNATVFETGSDGIIDIYKLDFDTWYYLEEITAPDPISDPNGGNSKATFKLLEKPVKFRLTEPADGSTDKYKIEIDAKETPANVAELGEGEIGIMVYNYVSFQLPHTGGIGTTIYTATGITLAALSAVLLLKKKKAE